MCNFRSSRDPVSMDMRRQRHPVELHPFQRRKMHEQPSATWIQIGKALQTSHIKAACASCVQYSFLVPAGTVARKRCSFMRLPFTNKWDTPSLLQFSIKHPRCLLALTCSHQSADINKGKMLLFFFFLPPWKCDCIIPF